MLKYSTKSNKFVLLFIALLFSGVLAAQPFYNPEGTVPANVTTDTNGSLNISAAHAYNGDESLQWNFTDESVLTFDEDYSQHLFTWGRNHFSVWVYNETPINDTVHVEFINDAGQMPFRFYFIANFTGWRRMLRSYRFDMLKDGSPWNVSEMRLRSPAGVAGTLFIDDIRFVTNQLARQSDRQMPDLRSLANSPYGSGDFFYQADTVPEDLPLEVPTGTTLTDYNTVYTRMKDAYLGPVPSAASLTQADGAYNTFNITETNGFIKGNPITDPSQIGGILTQYARHYRHTGDTDSYNKARNLLRLMLDSGIAGGSAFWFAGGSSGYDDRNFFQALSILGGEFDTELNDAIWDWLKWSSPTGNWWLTEEARWKGTFNTDNIHVLYAHYYSLITYAPNDAEGLRYLRGFQRYLERFCSPQPGLTDGLKIDGTGFHHLSHHTSYLYAYGTLVGMLNQLNGTQFQINKESYEFFRDCMFQLLVQEKDGANANSLCGRSPFNANLPVAAGWYRALAYVGAVHYDGTADPTAAQMYNRRFGTSDATLAAYGTGEPLNGFFQYNSSPMGIYRADDWTVTMRGLTTRYRGTEIYSNANRYGRYQSYGSIETMYSGGRTASGFFLNGISIVGYDWRRPNGTTTVQLPWGQMHPAGSREDTYNNGINFAGALRFQPTENSLRDGQGEIGLTALDLRSPHDNTFTFRVSRFCFDGMIVALGSHISNDDTDNVTSTNLFQNYITDTATPLTINGVEVTAYPHSETLTSGDNWLPDAVGTGYYVKAGDALEVRKQSQTSPLQSQNFNANTTMTTGDFAVAYIDHGTGPTDSGYEFVVKPGTDAAEMAAFSAVMQSNPPYAVLFHTENAHVIRNTGNDTESYVLFEQNVQLPNCVIKSADRQIVLHAQPEGEKLNIAVADIDKDYGGLKQADTTTVTHVELRGRWKIEEGDAGLSISGLTDTTTVLRVAAIEGRAYDATLIPEPANGMLQLLPSPETETVLLILPFSDQAYEIELKDENDTVVFAETMSMGQQTLDTAALPEGVYNICMDGEAKFVLELKRLGERVFRRLVIY